MAELLDFLFGADKELFVQRVDGETPIPLPWPARTLSAVLDTQGTLMGYIAWKAPHRPFLWLFVPRHFRPVHVAVFGATGNEMMKLTRQAFQETRIYASSGLRLGTVPWSFSRGRLTLLDENNDLLVTYRRGRERPLVFPFRDGADKVAGGVTMVWNGLAHGRFDCRKGCSVFFGNESWTPAQRCGFLAASTLLHHDFR